MRLPENQATDFSDGSNLSGLNVEDGEYIFTIQWYDDWEYDVPDLPEEEGYVSDLAYYRAYKNGELIASLDKFDGSDKWGYIVGESPCDCADVYLSLFIHDIIGEWVYCGPLILSDSDLIEGQESIDNLIRCYTQEITEITPGSNLDNYAQSLEDEEI